MTQTRIYFDNAASSFPKPPEVVEAMADFLKVCGNPGRGAHHFALEGARRIFEARENIANFLGINSSERLIFTGGCTASLNMVLRGLALQGHFRKGDLIVVSSFEHNSMMRPIAQLRDEHGISFLICPSGASFEQELRALVEKHSPKLVALSWASNVTGEVLPIKRIAQYLKGKNVPLLVDAAQAAGKLDADLSESHISFFCTSGHKGLMGPPGIGLLYVAPGVSLTPIISGGTGSRSESLEVPSAFPDHLEAGTLPGPAIAALSAGVDWVRQKGTANILNEELELADRFLAWVENADAVDAYRMGGLERLPVVSFSVKNVSPSEVADILDTEYGIATRAGLHCSAICHEALGTVKTGLVRVSFGTYNTRKEVDSLCLALEKIIARKAAC